MTSVATKSEVSPGRVIALGAMVYASLFGAISVYSGTRIGAGTWWWTLTEVLLAAAFGAFGFWQLSRGTSLRQTVLLVAFLHFAVRIGPIFISAWDAPGIPPLVHPLVFVVSLVLCSGWFLVSRIIVRSVVGPSDLRAREG